MKIEHIAIWVNDLERMKNFYMRYFSMDCSEKYENRKKGFSSYFLSFGLSARIEIMHRPDIPDQIGGKGVTNGLAHLAISVGSRDKVDELTEKIRKDGFEILSEPRITGDGYYESLISDPEGNHIEISE
jgi:lactoylglutathione lyase